MTDTQATASRAERRQITVMFCDLVGSTELSVTYDPEDMRKLLTDYRQACARAIKPYGGFISQYLGDGILVYFGYPRAHEHDAERAVRAAHDVVDALSRFNDPPLKVCIGIATGTVVVGDIVGDGVTELDVAVGQTPNLAARLMHMAGENEIFIADSTRQLIGDVFDLTDLGTPNLKGFSEPVRLWRVDGDPRIKSHSHAIHNKTYSTPLIARDEELGRLQDAWAKAQAGKGQVVLLSGEAGIGKSRLTRDFEEIFSADEQPVLINKYYCAENSQSSTLRPIVDKVLLDSEIQTGDTEDAKIRKLRQLFLTEHELSRENVSVILNFLSLENSLQAGARKLSPKERKERIFAILEEHICNYVREKPALLVVEDVHWCDPTTLELLDHIIRMRVPTLRLMIVLTARSEFLPTWPDEHYITNIKMKRFSPAAAETFIAALCDGSKLPEHIRQEIIRRGDRVPLYLEEVFKAASENFAIITQQSTENSGKYVNPLGVPNSLASSLMERLDRLGPVKTVAQTASAVGQSFPAGLLEQVGEFSANDLRDALTQLIETDVIVTHTGTEGPVYQFKHALLRDAAYASLLRAERKQLHAKIAKSLISHYPETEMREPELLAQHFAKGEMTEEAIRYWQLAGERSRERNANSEALEHITQGLDLLKTLPDAAGRHEQEVDLRTSSALALTALHGGGSEKVKENYARARQLTQDKSHTSEHFRIMVGSWLNSFIGGDLYEAQSLSNEVLALTEGKNDPSNHIEANRIRGMTLFYAGDFSGARSSIETAIALHDPEHHRRHALTFGLDPLVCCQSYLAYSHLFLGDTDAALSANDAAIDTARAVKHPYSEAFSLAFAAFVRQNLDHLEEANILADRTIKIAEQNEFQFWANQQRVVQAWADARRNGGKTSEMRTAVDGFLETGSTIGSTRIISMMAEVMLLGGELTEARALIERALTTANKTGEKFYVAEIHRLEAMHCHAIKGVAALGEVCNFFGRSLSISEYQGAGMWQHRTARSIGELSREISHDPETATRLLGLCEGNPASDQLRDIVSMARNLLDRLSRR
ncbi:MAG: AAA family ATPase [Pseudomonadota bacterium]